MRDFVSAMRDASGLWGRGAARRKAQTYGVRVPFGKRGGRLPARLHALKQRSHLFWVPAYTLVDGLSYDPNARKPNTRKHVYKKVDESLLNVSCLENTFHLKNIGIVINADSVQEDRR